MSNERSPRALCSTTIGISGMWLSFRQLIGCQHTSNQMVVKGGWIMPAQQEVDVEATPEEVWEALVTEEGRERWLGEPERDIHIEVVDAPNRLVWWWAD